MVIDRGGGPTFLSNKEGRNDQVQSEQSECGFFGPFGGLLGLSVLNRVGPWTRSKKLSETEKCLTVHHSLPTGPH